MVLFTLLVISFQNCSGLNSQKLDELLSGSEVTAEKSTSLQITTPIDSISSDKSSIEWNKQKGDISYTVQASADYLKIKDSSNCSSKEPEINRENLTDTHLNLENLRPGFFYFYKVCFIRESGVIESPVMSFKTLVDFDSKYLDVHASDRGIALLHESGGVILESSLVDRIKSLEDLSYFQNDVLKIVPTKAKSYFIKADGTMFYYDDDWALVVLDPKLPAEKVEDIIPLPKLEELFFFLEDTLYMENKAGFKEFSISSQNLKEVYPLGSTIVLEMNSGQFFYVDPNNGIVDLSKLAISQGVGEIEKLISGHSYNIRLSSIYFSTTEGKIGKISSDGLVSQETFLDNVVADSLQYSSKGSLAGLTKEGLLKLIVNQSERY